MVQKKEPRDVYAEITELIIASIENEPGNPTMPWHRGMASGGMPKNVDTDNFYNGVNIVVLWAVSHTKGYPSPLWGTYRQWKQAGAQVRKGERAAPVIFYKQLEVEPDPDNELDDGLRRFARASNVFNVAQVEGYELDSPKLLDPIERIASCETYVARTGATVVEEGSSAFYRPTSDTIHMPDNRLFTGTETQSRSESYYAVLFHELTHYAAYRIMPRRSSEPFQARRYRRGMSA